MRLRRALIAASCWASGAEAREIRAAGGFGAEAPDGEQLFLRGGHNLQVDRAPDVARIILEQVQAAN